MCGLRTRPLVDADPPILLDQRPDNDAVVPFGYLCRLQYLPFLCILLFNDAKFKKDCIFLRSADRGSLTKTGGLRRTENLTISTSRVRSDRAVTRRPAVQRSRHLTGARAKPAARPRSCDARTDVCVHRRRCGRLDARFIQPITLSLIHI